MGVSFEKLDKLQEFKAIKNIPFPLYNDQDGKFTKKYQVDDYPTMIGLNKDRKIAFIEFGNRPTKNLEDFLKLL